MQIQLTKNKTIEVNFPFGGGGGGSRPRSRGLSDVVGVELRLGDPRGCPAVRLVRKKGKIHVYAAGFVKPPEGEMPMSWEELSKQSTWALPVDFQSPGAAIAVSSEDSFLRQTTPDALTADAKAAPKIALEQPGRKKIGLRSLKDSAPAPVAAPAADRKSVV